MARQSRRPRVLAIIILVIGAIFIVAGGVTWFQVQNQLEDEKITVADDADFLAGDEVNGPFSAYAQADVINKHALEATNGKTYAELARDDPARQTAMSASFLRASLYTSVVAFGVAALAVGLGITLILIALALMSVAKAAVREAEPTT
jgi:cell division septal protein FtsQ